VIRHSILLLAAAVATTACERPEAEPPVLLDDGLQPSTMHCDISAPPPGVRTLQVVFSCDEQPVGTWRALPDGEADTLAFALNSLLRGPTQAERDAGLASFFSEATAGMLNDARIIDGVAHVDFADFSGLMPNASASAGSAMLLDQIAGTIFQFDGINEADITFNGDCDAFWNWIQRGCQRLLRDEPG
jgi:hypothetical protein